MENPTFYIVDVFAQEKYAGNQLAVFRGARHLPDATLQKIAAEMNYSETTFVLSDEKRDGGYDVRIFTPREEVPFAGHPTLGTAYVIQREILSRPVDRLTLSFVAGRIPVTFGEVLWMEQLSPVFGETLDPTPISRVLGLSEDELDARYPVQEVSTGLPAIIVPVNDLAALKRCRVDRGRYFELVEGTEANNVFVFCPEPYEEADLAARMFGDYYGVPEDPATGSAAGCLAGYLVEHCYFSSDSIDLRLEQGYEVGRPSLLYLRARKEGDDINVSVGGKVQMVAKGELL
jgi:trans-2,3-dihydro-3-hydroxyanthranilate isomerase